MKKVFKMKDEHGNEKKFTVNDNGELIPYVEKKPVAEVPWEASNDILSTCRFLKLSRGTVMKLIELGILKAVKAGKRWIVPGWAIEAFLQQPKQGA